jgi:uncharacterized membrane protein
MFLFAMIRPNIKSWSCGGKEKGWGVLRLTPNLRPCRGLIADSEAMSNRRRQSQYMFDFLARAWRASITTTFLAGFILLLPIVLTTVIIAYIVNWLKGALGPGTILGDILTQLGVGLVGNDQQRFAFFAGVFIVLFGTWCLGILVRARAAQSIHETVDWLFTKLPVVRSIYNPISRVVRVVTEKGGGDFSGMTVVACRFGGPSGVDILALLATQEVYVINGERRKMVYLPTAPLPMSGGLVLVAEDAVVRVPDMKVDDLLKIYFSLGALAPESMPNSMRVRQDILATEQKLAHDSAPNGEQRKGV